MPKKLAGPLLLACAVALAYASTLFAQLTMSTIRGSARDPSGAVVGAAKITITNLGTNISRSTGANDNGDYEIPDLPRGTYRLIASPPGLQNFVADNIILETNQIRRIDVAFEIGAVDAQVTVSPDPPAIPTDTPKIQPSSPNPP